MLAVLTPGPSSKVSATVLPLPGADLWAPYGAAGQLVDTCGAVTCGGAATCPLGIRAGGPAGPSLPGGGWVAAAAGSTVNTPVTPRAIAAAKSRSEEADTGVSQPAPAGRGHGRSLIKLNNQVQSIKRADKSPGPSGLTTRDLWQP